MSRATRAVVSLQRCASTLLQTKKKALQSKTFLDFGARGRLASAIFYKGFSRVLKLGIHLGIHNAQCFVCTRRCL